MKELRPLKAVRKYCMECSNDQPKEIRLCPSNGEEAPMCPLYALRFGKNPTNESTIKLIRQKCLDCVNNSIKGASKRVKECEFTDCPLFPYKLGKNPARKGKGGMSIPKNRSSPKKVNRI
jgi:hypothetical protein